MARNQEKAQSMLSRFREVQNAELGISVGKSQRRPYLASECTNLPDCEKWRSQIIREIAKKISQIQNAALGEFRLRDLNDEINKLLREKRHWERQIVDLGGPDYTKISNKMVDSDGKEVPGSRGYKYFGAARDLPGIRELFQKSTSGGGGGYDQSSRKLKYDLKRRIDGDYYGYRDEDDGVLVALEAEAEKELRERRQLKRKISS
eukprot:Nk52_evm1s75 gene=Nk52_evmTU1s75